MGATKLVVYAVVGYLLWTKAVGLYHFAYPEHEPPYIAPMWSAEVLHSNFSLYVYVSRSPELFEDHLDDSSPHHATLLYEDPAFMLGRELSVSVPSSLVHATMTSPVAAPAHPARKSSSSDSRVDKHAALWLHALLTFPGVSPRLALDAASATAPHTPCGFAARDPARRSAATPPPPHLLASRFSTPVVVSIPPSRTAVAPRFDIAARNAEQLRYTVPVNGSMVKGTAPYTDPCGPGHVPPTRLTFQRKEWAAGRFGGNAGTDVETNSGDSGSGAAVGARPIPAYTSLGAVRGSGARDRGSGLTVGQNGRGDGMGKAVTVDAPLLVWAFRSRALLLLSATDVCYGTQSAPAAVVGVVNGRVVGGPSSAAEARAVAKVAMSAVNDSVAAAIVEAAVLGHGGVQSRSGVKVRGEDGGVPPCGGEGGKVVGLYPPLGGFVEEAVTAATVFPVGAAVATRGRGGSDEVVAAPAGREGGRSDVALWALGAEGGGCFTQTTAASTTPSSPSSTSSSSFFSFLSPLPAEATLASSSSLSSVSPATAASSVSTIDSLFDTEAAAAARDATHAGSGCDAFRLTLSTRVASEFGWRLQHTIGSGLTNTERMLGNATTAITEVDALRSLIFSAHTAILVGVFAITFAHVVLDVVAIYGDISHYSQPADSLVGLSVRNAAAEVLCEGVAAAFLLRSGAGLLVLLPSLAVVMVALYKWARLLRVKVTPFVPLPQRLTLPTLGLTASPPSIPLPLLGGSRIGIRVSRAPPPTSASAVHRAELTKSVDRLTTTALLTLTVPAAIGWGVYAWLKHQPFGAGGVHAAAEAAAEAVTATLSPANVAAASAVVSAPAAAAAASAEALLRSTLSFIGVSSIFGFGVESHVGRLLQLLVVAWRAPFTLWVLETATMFVYGVQFVLMLPQVILNHKLRSVEHLPWPALVAKAVRTFIDDVFAALMPMPTLHRLAVLRDDVVFIIFLVQYFVYPRKSAKARAADSTMVGAGKVADDASVSGEKAALAPASPSSDETTGVTKGVDASAPRAGGEVGDSVSSSGTSTTLRQRQKRKG